VPAAPPARAKNVILFLGDAGGIRTLSAASIHGYGETRRLFIHAMPHIALAETSSASSWVTDSAAGMTAIVTGHKTHNGVIAQSAAAVRGARDGEPLKTILEYAEERGLSTGVVSNSSVASATPAALYAHANDRRKVGEIFAQVLSPRFGDGVDVIMGPGREEISKATAALGLDLEPALLRNGYAVPGSLEEVPPEARRVVVLAGSGEFELDAATRLAIGVLSRNPNGFFLMVESDLHTEQVVRGLDRTVALDRIVRESHERLRDQQTLILYTADHSYDLSVHGGSKGQALLTEADRAAATGDQESIRLANLRRDDHHAAEEVLVAAAGPGAERVRGILSNTDLFHIMLAAYGWQTATPSAR
jgi:alkaline phosphatase